ncbi:hypothetical protein PR048_024829, partial [Dryococelus australis]
MPDHEVENPKLPSGEGNSASFREIREILDIFEVKEKIPGSQNWVFTTTSVLPILFCMLFAVENEEHADFLRKRQHISTIETMSPTRSLLQQGMSGHGYPGYCTLRNGMPLQELNSIGAKHKMVSCSVVLSLAHTNSFFITQSYIRHAYKK